MEDSGLIIDTPEVPKTFHQLGILVLDGSGSMKEIAKQQLTKAQEVELGVKELFTRLDVSRVKNNFSFAVIKFDNTATVTLQPTPFTQIDYYTEDFNPLNGKGGGTAIFEALNAANQLAVNFLNNAPVDGVKHSVVILLMTDGWCFKPSQTKAVAEQIKQNPNIVIATALFKKVGSQDDELDKASLLLKEVATDPVKYYATVHDGETLRKFFEASISQSCGTKINNK